MVSRRGRQGAAVTSIALILVAAGCGGAPNLADLDLTDVVDVEEQAVLEAEAMQSCMASAGFPGFVPVVLGPVASAGAPFPLADLVDLVVSDAATSPRADPNAELVAALPEAEQEDYFAAFIECDDLRAETRRATDSARGSAQAVLQDALEELHNSTDYQLALRAYVDCMHAVGWQVSDLGVADGIIMEALHRAVDDESPFEPGSDSDFGFAGVVFDSELLAEARVLLQRLVEADAQCGSDTLEPVYASFNAEYGLLVGALYGLAPDAVNRVRL